MPHPKLDKAVVLGGIALLLASSIADAQWVMVARRAIGRVEQISQQSPQSGGANYDAAAVMLEAPADKVYTAVVRGVKARQDVKVTQEDPAAMLIQFTNGQQIAGIKVNGLDDNLTHLLISSAHSGNQPNAANLVLDSVLRVCAEMKVECSKAQN